MGTAIGMDERHHVVVHTDGARRTIEATMSPGEVLVATTSVGNWLAAWEHDGDLAEQVTFSLDADEATEVEARVVPVEEAERHGWLR